MIGKKPCIALLATNLYDDYPRLICKGVTEAANKADVNVVLFRGESLNPPWPFTYQYTNVYELIDAGYVDAIILMSGVLCNYISIEDYNRFVDHFQGIPKVSISIPLPGIPSIMVDNSSGIIETIHHLAHHHGKSRIAFIKGPENNQEAKIRLKAYLDGLKLAGLKVDEKLIVDGNFIYESGVDAVKTLIDTRQAGFDAIMASNDTMAIGVLNELNRRGIPVPEKIAVTGFDNLPDCDYTTPPLTTIKQPIYVQGVKSLEYALALTQGVKTEPEIILPTIMINRHSCGCMKQKSDIKIHDIWNINSGVHKPVLVIDRKPVEKKLRHILEINDMVGPRSALCEDYLDCLFALTEKDSLQENELQFYQDKLVQLIEFHEKIECAFGYWIEILNQLEQFTIQYRQNASSLLFRLFEQSRDLIEIRNESYINYISVRYREKELFTRLWSQQIIASVTQDEMLLKLTDCLAGLNLTTCYLFTFGTAVIHNNDSVWTMPEKVNLLLATSQITGKTDIITNMAGLSPKTFIPEKFLNCDISMNYVVLPVYYLETYYGHIIFQLETGKSDNYEFISAIIASAYRSILLLEQRENLLKMLRKRNTEMENDILMARRIQSQLMPVKSPRDYLAFYYKPMDIVGGDFLDFVEYRESNWVGIFISDVSGHGVPAAFITSMIKSVIQQTRLLQDDPAYLLKALNQALYDQTGSNFVTAFYGIFFRESGLLIYANAGHHQPYIIHKNRAVPLDKDNRSIPLAIMSNLDMIREKKSYMNASVQLEPGSKVVFYTDGLTDAVSRDHPELDFETNCLESVLLKNAEMPARDFVEQTYQELVHFHGDENFSDDVCLICLDVPGRKL